MFMMIFSTNFMAMSSVLWPKPQHDKFPWAVDTYTFEQMMQDGKALQWWTSHFLWQSFAKAFDVTFTNENNEKEYVYATSRWVTTRMIWIYNYGS